VGRIGRFISPILMVDGIRHASLGKILEYLKNKHGETEKNRGLLFKACHSLGIHAFRIQNVVLHSVSCLFEYEYDAVGAEVVLDDDND